MKYIKIKLSLLIVIALLVGCTHKSNINDSNYNDHPSLETSQITTSDDDTYEITECDFCKK